MKRDEMIKELEKLVDDMQYSLANSEQMWQSKESHARIVGYLEAALDQAQKKIQQIIEE